MGEFKVKTDRVKSVVSQHQSMSGELSGIRDELYSIRSSLRFKIAQRERIDRRLTQQGEEIVREKEKMDRLAGSLNDIADLYIKTESALCGLEAGEGKPDLGQIDEVYNFPIYIIPPPGTVPWNGGSVFDKKIWDNILKEPTGDHVQSVVDQFLDDEKENGFMRKMKEQEDKVDDWSKAHTEEHRNARVYDLKNHTHEDIDLDNKEAAKKFDENMKDTRLESEIKLASIGGSLGAVSAWNGKASAGDENGTHASAEADFFKAEAHAEAYAGLYQTDPETGKTSFKPGIGVSAGASVSAFTAEEEAQLGNDMLGGYVKSTQTVGRLGAKADASMGLYDRDGNFNPSLYAGGSLEAIAGEVTGAVGAKILGTDVGVSGSLNYGIGAHAKAGYKDGKLSLDIGATLGVGASVKLEVDVSGTIDAVCGKAEAAWNALKGWF